MMEANFKTYPKYKDSGVEWLGEIPEGWLIYPLHVLMKFRSGSAHEPFVDAKGDYICVNSRFVSTEGRTVKKCTKNIMPAFKNDILMVMSDLPNGRALAKAYFVKNENNNLAVNQRVCALSTYKGYAKYFFYYLDRNVGLLEKDDGCNQTHLSNDNYRKLKVAFPPLNEQIAIASFLDEKVGKVDEAIAQKEQLIELLTERKQIIIQNAVTKGLNPNAPMKDSGIEWIGQIPEHWEVKNFRYAFRFLNQQRVPLSAVEREKKQGVHPYYGASGIIDHIDDYIFDEKLILIAEDGANLLSKSTPLAFVADGKYWVNNHAHIVKPLAEGFQYWAEQLSLIDYTTSITGAAQPKLSRENLGAVKVVVPPTAEIHLISKAFKSKTVRIDQAIRQAKQSISKLKEYKATLINSAVTGKINVSQYGY